MSANDTTPPLSLTQARAMIEFALRSDTPLHVIGSPGIGKTAIIAAIAKAMGVPLYTLILAQCLPEDIGGAPVPRADRLERLPMGPIADACERPGILFLDEFSQANAPLQGASLRLINERDAGDRKLHPNTRIILASNEAHEAANGNDITPPALNRMTRIVVAPVKAEVQAYFDGVGAPGSQARTLAVDFSATLEVAPHLLVTSPPKGTAASGRPWASPRAWERAIKLCASMLDGGESDFSELFAAGLVGNLGENIAHAYMAIRKVRAELPSHAEILKSPSDARLPETSATRCASIGIIAQVALEDPCAAWVYADRLSDEFRIASARHLLKVAINATKRSPHFDQAQRARARVLGAIGANLNLGNV